MEWLASLWPFRREALLEYTGEAGQCLPEVAVSTGVAMMPENSTRSLEL